jgi:hypothetical protein
VALVTLALLTAVLVLALRDRPSHVLYDAERETGAGERPAHSRLHYLGWMLALLAAAGALGFVLGVFVFISVFLRMKAGVAWTRALLGAAGAVVLLSVMSRLLVLDYPEGILQHLVAMPWPFN